MALTPSPDAFRDSEPAPVLQKHGREAHIALFRDKAEEIRAIARMMSREDTRRTLLSLARTYGQMADTMSRIRRPEDS